MSKNPVIFNIQNIGKYPPKNYSPERKAKYMAKRAFYDMTAEYNVMSYYADNKKAEKAFTIEDYMTKEKHQNSGMFNLSKVLTPEEVVDLKERLANTESYIWHGFISLSREMSLYYLSQENWQKLARRTFPTFFRNMGLDPDNVEIFISLHSDTNNKHVHFEFWEKEPRSIDSKGRKCYKRKGTIPKHVIADMVLRLTHEVDGNKKDYHTARDRTMTMLAENKNSILRMDKIKRKLIDLAESFPKEGRLQYRSDNMKALRPEIDKVYKDILAANPKLLDAEIAIQKELKARRLSYEKMKENNKLDYDVGKKIEALDFDYRCRVGNRVIALALEARKDERNEMQEHATNMKARKVVARQNRQMLDRAVQNFIRALPNTQRDVQRNFMESLKQIEIEMKVKQDEQK